MQGARLPAQCPLSLKRPGPGGVFEVCEPMVRHSLKVAEGRVAFDGVLLLEAVELGRVHVHPCQHLNKAKQKRKAASACQGGEEERRRRDDIGHQNGLVTIKGLQIKKMDYFRNEERLCRERARTE